MRVLTVSGAIGPATSDYVTRAINSSHPPDVDMLVLKIDTPGGLDKSMRDMIQAILNSKVPVVAYVSPQGARAASAGTYILYASQVAAMAPATNLGAATPVSIAAPGIGQPKNPNPDEAKQGSGDENADQVRGNKSALEQKQINDAVAYIRGLAELNGRNAEWAEDAVRGAASLSANAALEQQVIELIASDLDDLFQQLNGRTIKLQSETHQLVIRNIVIEPLAPDWRNEFLSVITDPNVAYILMLIGIYGLVLEFYNPGMGVPGIVGAICLFLALYAFQVLPVSYTGIALVLLGLGLMIAEAFAPSFGVLGIGGVVAFVFGSIILMDTRIPAFQIALPLIIALAVLSALVLIVVARLMLRSRKVETVSGTEAMIGEEVEVISFTEGRGKVILHGELWNARSSAREINSGHKARIKQIEGLELLVEPLQEE